MDRPLFGTTIGSSSVTRHTYLDRVPAEGKHLSMWIILTCGDVALGQIAISLDEERGGEEEAAAHHGYEGAEQQGELQ